MPVPLLTMSVLVGGLSYGLVRFFTPKCKNGGQAPLQKVMPDEIQLEFTRALSSKDPKTLALLGQKYLHEGYTAEGILLIKRARLRLLSPELKAARREAYRKGMSSRDPHAVRNLAAAFEGEGATDAAKSLREYADSLKFIL